MIIVPYQPNHFPMIDEWYSHYNLKMHEFLLPSTGFIVEGMAVGFIYLTNSPQAWIENLCKNPHIDKDISNEALDLVLIELMNFAKVSGVKLVVADTLFNSVALRAIRHGATQDENKYTRLYRSL